MERYLAFFQKLINSPSKEIRLLANIVGRDPRSTTSKNLIYIKQLSGLDPWDFSSQNIKKNLPVKEVPENEKWRLGLLSSLMTLKHEKNLLAEDNHRNSPM